MEREIKAADGTVLFARAWNPTTTPKGVVGIVHGLGEHSGRYASVAKSFVEAGYSVVAYDQRGHGRTGGSLPSFETLLGEVEQLVDQMHVQSGAPRYLFGQSLGGTLVLNYALRHKLNNNRPLTGAIASSPLLTTTIPPPRWKTTIAKWIVKLWPGFELSNGLDPNQLSHDPVEVAKYKNDPLVHSRISAILGLSMLEAGQWALHHAGELKLPLLLMHGTADQITSADASREFASKAGEQCSLKLWNGMFHELHFETERDTIAEYLLSWMARCSLPTDKASTL